MELAEAFVMRLTAPPGTDRAPPLLFEIEARHYAVVKRSYAEMFAEEQTIEDQETNEDAAKAMEQVFAPLLEEAKAQTAEAKAQTAAAERRARASELSVKAAHDFAAVTDMRV